METPRKFIIARKFIIYLLLFFNVIQRLATTGILESLAWTFCSEQKGRLCIVKDIGLFWTINHSKYTVI